MHKQWKQYKSNLREINGGVVSPSPSQAHQLILLWNYYHKNLPKRYQIVWSNPTSPSAWQADKDNCNSIKNSIIFILKDKHITLPKATDDGYWDELTTDYVYVEGRN